MGLPPNPQSAAQQQAAALRQNMATLAGLSPAQLQALTHQPALAQALLQSRANVNMNGANGGVGGLQGSNPAVAAAQQEAFLAALSRQQQQQQQQGGGGGDPGSGGGLNPNPTPLIGQEGSNNPPPSQGTQAGLAGNPGQDPGQGGVDQQRRLSLAQVALHLAHNGITIDQVRVRV